MPLKKSVIKLVLGVFSTTQLKYGDLSLGGAAWKLFDNWFASAAKEVRDEAFLVEYGFKFVFHMVGGIDDLGLLPLDRLQSCYISAANLQDG